MDYKEKQKIKDDTQQMRLNPNGKGILPNTTFLKQYFPELDYNDTVVCPFCLTLETLAKNFKLTKGIYGFYECQNCKSLLTKKTLSEIRYMTPEAFATWVYNHRLDGFWSKIKPNFKEWTLTLSTFEYTFDLRFWSRYKELKGE